MDIVNNYEGVNEEIDEITALSKNNDYLSSKVNNIFGGIGNGANDMYFTHHDSSNSNKSQPAYSRFFPRNLSQNVTIPCFIQIG